MRGALRARAPPARGAPMYDVARRRRSTRAQRQRGCFIYVPAEELERAGYTSAEPPPYYRVWGRKRGSVIVQLYRSA